VHVLRAPRLLIISLIRMYLPGALCGSVFLDQGFVDYMRNTLGDKIFNSMKVRIYCTIY